MIDDFLLPSAPLRRAKKVVHKIEIPVPYVRLRIWRVPQIREIVADDRPGLETGLISFTIYQHPLMGPCWVQLPALPGYSIWEIRPQYLSDRVRWSLMEMLNLLNNSMQANHFLLNSEYHSQAFREEYARVVGPVGITDGLVDLSPEIPDEVRDSGKFKEYRDYLESLNTSLII